MVGYFTHLDAAPFLRQFDLLERSGGLRQTWGYAGEQFIVRSRQRGWMTEQEADRWSIEMLGLTLWDLYGADAA